MKLFSTLRVVGFCGLASLLLGCATTSDPTSAVLKGTDLTLGFMNHQVTVISAIDGNLAYVVPPYDAKLKPGMHEFGYTFISRAALGLFQNSQGKIAFDLKEQHTYRIELVPLAPPLGEVRLIDLTNTPEAVVEAVPVEVRSGGSDGAQRMGVIVTIIRIRK